MNWICFGAPLNSRRCKMKLAVIQNPVATTIEGYPKDLVDGVSDDEARKREDRDQLVHAATS